MVKYDSLVPADKKNKLAGKRLSIALSEHNLKPRNIVKTEKWKKLGLHKSGTSVQGWINNGVPIVGIAYDKQIHVIELLAEYFGVEPNDFVDNKISNPEFREKIKNSIRKGKTEDKERVINVSVELQKDLENARERLSTSITDYLTAYYSCQNENINFTKDAVEKAVEAYNQIVRFAKEAGEKVEGLNELDAATVLEEAKEIEVKVVREPKDNSEYYDRKRESLLAKLKQEKARKKKLSDSFEKLKKVTKNL